jgi:hypothetical protein
MYFDGHNPPHFHAIYAGNEAEITIEPIEILEGKLPARAASMVFEWAALHQRELLRNWHRLHNEQMAERIKPLKYEVIVFPRIRGARHVGGTSVPTAWS